MRDTDASSLYIRYSMTYFADPEKESILPITPIVISATGQCSDPFFDVSVDPNSSWFTMASTYKPPFVGSILLVYPVLGHNGTDLLLQRIDVSLLVFCCISVALLVLVIDRSAAKRLNRFESSKKDGWFSAWEQHSGPDNLPGVSQQGHAFLQQVPDQQRHVFLLSSDRRVFLFSH